MMSEFPFWLDRAFLGSSCLLYALALYLGLPRYGQARRLAFVSVLAVAFLTQSIGLVFRGFEVGSIPLTNTFELFQWLGWWSIALAYSLQRTLELPFLKYLTTFLGFFLSLLSLSIPAWDTPVASLHTPSLRLHVILAVLSYGCFMVLSVSCCMHLLQHKALKSLGSGFAHKLATWLPSIHSLEKAQWRLNLLGLEALSAAMVLGTLEVIGSSASLGGLKWILVVATWTLAGALLYLRRARLSVEMLTLGTLLLFLLVLFSLWTFSSQATS